MPIRLVKIRGTPYEMGQQLGKQAADLIRHPVLTYFDLFSQQITPQEKGAFIKKYEDIIERHAPDFVSEIRGIAKGANLDYDTALFLQVAWDFLVGYLPVEVRTKVGADMNIDSISTSCTAFVAAGKATADRKAIAAQNSDASSMLYDGCIAVAAEPRDGYKFLGLSDAAGSACVIGFNEKGLGLMGSGIRQYKEANFGFPVMLAYRIILEKCSNVDDTIDTMKEFPRWGHMGGNLDVVDARGYVARIACSSQLLTAMSSQNNFVASTNHYHDLEMRHFGPLPEDYASSYERYDRIVELLTYNHGKISVEIAMAVLSDHKFGIVEPETTKSICRHSKATGTYACTIARPTERKLWISKGFPCEREFSTFTI